MFQFFRQTFQRARKERLPQIAGSLTFTTVLSGVPFLAICFALFTRYPSLFKRFKDAIEALLLRNLLPADIAQPVLRHLGQFAANAGGLTWAGSLFLLATSLALLLTVENALNQIWGVKRNRPFLKRVGLYLAMLALGPPVLGVSLWASSYLLGMSMGWIEALPPAAHAALNFAPALLGAVALACLFRVVPNTRVGWPQALVGGALGSIAIELAKRGFAAYLLKLPTYKAVYGAFAVLPAFLLWVYVSWLVTLAAALVAANLGRPAGKGGRS
ncbi:YihY family inner membrane protein [Rhizobacter sp. J219]|uniref:YihY family inner membrane protein n=1 Tax=Rhizobacter sp. J219 TaxID=2898430 RepID=UPI002151A3AB|nr:YihY family inner membrane protein [Rhizobacter sp. J219]MCR5883771.1 YihY family inner membrane protein [Rhizobacter sp. J219]